MPKRRYTSAVEPHDHDDAPTMNPDEITAELDELLEDPPIDTCEMIERLEPIPAWEGSLAIVDRLGYAPPRSLVETTLRCALLLLLGRICPIHQRQVLEGLLVRETEEALSLLIWLEADACVGSALERITRLRQQAEGRRLENGPASIH